MIVQTCITAMSAIQTMIYLGCYGEVYLYPALPLLAKLLSKNQLR